MIGSIPKNQWLTKPDGNIIGTLTDARVVSTAVGAAAGALLEKQLWTQMRDTFGIASLENGKLKFYTVNEQGKAGEENPAFFNNRQLARLGLVVVCVAGIEYVPSGHAQYAFLGVAAVAMAHIFQDVFPALK